MNYGGLARQIRTTEGQKIMINEKLEMIDCRITRMNYCKITIVNNETKSYIYHVSSIISNHNKVH